jgi:hypothetical protein
MLIGLSWREWQPRIGVKSKGMGCDRGGYLLWIAKPVENWITLEGAHAASDIVP